MKRWIPRIPVPTEERHDHGHEHERARPPNSPPLPPPPGAAITQQPKDVAYASMPATSESVTGVRRRSLKMTKTDSPHDACDELALYRYKDLTLNDFNPIKVIGQGAYGKVRLVTYKGDQSNRLYAMKSMSKAKLIDAKNKEHLRTERLILERMYNPFLTHLEFAFQTPDKIYMVMDFMSGGELFFWMEKKRRFPESCVKLYVAEITLAIEALHSKNFIYRDLKPENILMDAEGHIKLTDFGLAKGGITGSGPQGGTMTFCGTPDYMAPEMILRMGHGKAVDWWALGILFFELMCGLPPFYDKNPQEVFRKIQRDPLTFPYHGQQISEPAKSVIRGLLERDFTKRLGSGPTDAMELKLKKFFGLEYFDQVQSKAIVPELTPSKLNSDDDVINFDKVFTDKDVIGSLRMEIDNNGPKNHIDDFTFVGGGHGNPL